MKQSQSSYSRVSRSVRGYGRKWQEARRLWLIDNPLCVMCMQMGKVVSASVVNHRIPHRGNMNLFWDKGNWESMCKPCHDKHCQIRDLGGPLLGAGIDGMPLDPSHHWS